ncbi:phosphoribosylanthranilate isomerase [Larkinella soli]|uniref:phosphoribosylanthranilate isomerase n=1 Tax=Larkinella soli TaxID=1770527 RepID=UPI000FFC62BE|nr:phosphoribosylanthranilate isomerase [Larkinella soli]
MRIKVCCISSVEEARTAVGAGASALGLVGRMPSGPGVIGDELIRTIAWSVPPPVATFLLTSEPTAEAVIEHHRRVHTNTLQLVDAMPEGSYRVLRAALPGIKLVQVIHVLDEVSLDEALAAAEQVDALLLDSGNPKLAVKELGGTGRRHDWSISRRIVEQSRVPVFLAGGLRPENVREAIDTVQPYGLDICSGVRTDGKLDPEKLERFFRQALN